MTTIAATIDAPQSDAALAQEFAAFETQILRTRPHAQLAERLDAELARRKRLAQRLAGLTLVGAVADAWCSACHGVAGVEGHNRRCADSGERVYRATPWPMAVAGEWVA